MNELFDRGKKYGLLKKGQKLCITGGFPHSSGLPCFTDGPAAVSARILISLGAGTILGTSLDSAAEVSPSQIKSPKN